MEIINISIDIEVYRLIEQRRINFNEDHNTILKRALSGKDQSNESIYTPNTSGLFWKGILLKNGLSMRCHYKGKQYTSIIENGKFCLNGKEFKSPSAAAMYVTNGTNVNGWTFWEYYNNNTNEWEIIDSLRKK